MTRFQALRQTGAATSIGQNYLEQGRYAEAIVSTGAESDLIDKNAPPVDDTRPNETSWTYFKKVMEKKKLAK